MNTQKTSNNELLKQIATEVEDPELKKKLIDALLEQEDQSTHVRYNELHMAVHPDAVPSNIRLQKLVILIVGVVFFLWMNAWANGTPKSDTSYPALRLISIFGPVIFWLRYKHLNNISSWQQREKKTTRKFWGARIQPSVDDK